MKRLILLAVLLLTGCAYAGPQKAAVLPSPTPEMLIVRPTRTVQTSEIAPIVLTLTAWPTQTPTAQCMNIIGNVSADGMIYHCYGWRDYSKISFNAAEGDRIFCTEDEARAAGFREPDYSHGPCR